MNEENDAFVIKNIAGVIKELKQDKTEESMLLVEKLQKVVGFSKEEKQLKSEIKEKEAELHLKTKETIEALSDEEIKEMLQIKWIDPIYDEMMKLAVQCVDRLQKKIDELTKKYADTYESIEMEIREAEKSLSQMLSELTGNEADMAGIREFQKLLGGDF